MVKEYKKGEVFCAVCFKPMTDPAGIERGFHRHCKALREFHKTQNIQHVKRILGHRSIMTTQRYVELYEDLYSNQERETITEIALNIQEAKKLRDRGFRYECGQFNDGGMLFWRYK